MIVTPEEFGAVGDGITDDTTAINNAFNSGNIVVFNHKTYLIDGVEGTIINNGVIIGNNAILKIKPNNSEYYYGIKATGKTFITDLSIIGERDEHGGTTGEWGHCLSLIDCHDTVINNVTCNNGWGDGLYIGITDDNKPYPNKNITITNSNFDNNRRNNISVVHGINVIIENCILSNAKGTNPQAGIDIETNNKLQKCEVIIKECIFKDNFFSSVSVIGDTAQCSVINCTCDNQNTVIASDFNVYNGGQLTVANVHFKNAKDICFFASANKSKLIALNTTIDKLSKQTQQQNTDHVLVKGQNGATLIVKKLVCSDVITTHMLVYANDPTVNVELSDFYFDGKVNVYHNCNFKAKNMPPFKINVANLTIEDDSWWTSYIYNLNYDGTWNINTNQPEQITFMPGSNKTLTLIGNANHTGKVDELITIYKAGDTYRTLIYNV